MFQESQRLLQLAQADEVSELSNPSSGYEDDDSVDSMDLSSESIDSETDSSFFSDISDISGFSDLDDSSLSSTDASSSTNTSGMYLKMKARFRTYYTKLTTAFESPNIVWGRRMLIADVDEPDDETEFRFRKEHLQHLADTLWPRLSRYLVGTRESILCSNSYRVPYETGLLLVLYRFSFPRRYRPDMERYFGMRRAHISAALITFINAMYALAIPYLSDPWIHRHRFRYYAYLIWSKTGGLVDHLWGFIDGTLRKTARPSYFQKLMYSGHKRAHGIKFQSVVTPDGLFACLFGPVNGKRHDSYMLRVSRLLVRLNEIMPYQGNMYALYGDPAYPQFPYLYGGFKLPREGSVQAAFNTAMSAVREVVEWNFKDIVVNWAYLDWKAGMKIFEKPVAKYYVVAAFLCNCRSFYYENQTSNYFGAETYTLQDYLDLIPEP